MLVNPSPMMIYIFDHMMIVSHEFVLSYESNFRIFSIHHMNQNFLFHMDDTHHMKANICETIVKIMVFDKKKSCKKLFFSRFSQVYKNVLVFI